MNRRTGRFPTTRSPRQQPDTHRLISQAGALSTDIWGARLSDLALADIGLIDRNLYERSCDVRWWAADGTVAGALERPSPESRAFASKRLRILLDSYTAYFDIEPRGQDCLIARASSPG